MKAGQQSIFSGELAQNEFARAALLVAIALQTCSLRQKTLLMIGDQINTKAGDELLICSLEVCQATSFL